MKDSLLTGKQKKEIIKFIKEKDFVNVISILEKIKTAHAGTAKTKDKRFVIREVVRFILNDGIHHEKFFFNIGSYFCKMKEDVAKEIGISLIWRGYKFNPEKVKKYLIKIADDPNWEVREYAGGAFGNIISNNKDFYKTALQWTTHPSENVRRAVLFSALGLKKKETLSKAFSIIEILMFDRSRYVKKNLGPFILGSYFGNAFPDETLRHLKKWSKVTEENVRWNIIMAFNNSFGNKYPQEAFNILKCFTGDVDLGVRRALMSTLNFLSKRHKKSVVEFKLKNKMNVIEKH